MLKKTIGSSLLLLSLVLSGSANALQIKTVTDNETIVTRISSLDVTRILVKGDRIKSLKGVKGAYTRENDETNGEIYLQPTPLYQNRAFTILIETEQGRHYSLLLNPLAVPSEAVMLVPKNMGQKDKAHFEQTSPYELTLSHLIRAMSNGLTPEGYEVHEANSKKSYRLGDFARLHLKTIYQGRKFRGEIFELTNTKTVPIDLDERAFYKSGTRAVSLETVTVLPKDTIKIYRVVSHA